MNSHIINLLVQNKNRVVLTGWLLCGLLTLLVYYGFEAYTQANFAKDLQHRAQREAVNFQATTLNGQIMGGIKLAGRVDKSVKMAASDMTPEALTQFEKQLSEMQSIASGLQIDHLFVVNRDGVVKSAWAGKNNDVIRNYLKGINVERYRSSFYLNDRPYFSAAMAGKESVIATVSSSMLQRMLFFTAPTYLSSERQSAASGALIARMGIDVIDNYFMAQGSLLGALISPEGIVFSTNKADLLFKPVGVMDDARLKKIQASKRYGNAALKIAQMKPLAPFTSKNYLIGKDKYLVIRTSINWNDPQGAWELVLMGRHSEATPALAHWTLTSLVFILSGLLVVFATRVLRDVAIQVKQKQELTKQTALLNTLIETMPYPIFYLDAKGYILGCNQKFSVEMRTDKLQLIGQHYSSPKFEALARFFSPQQWSSALGGNVNLQVESGMEYLDGSKVDLMVFLSGFSLASGDNGGCVGAMIDITPHKAAERTLAVAKEMAEQATRSKSDFLANMSHEIRTPLNAIIGFTQILHSTQLSEEQNSYLGKTQGAAEHLMGLINDILDFSKIEAGKLELELASVNLWDCLSKVSDIMAAKAHNKGLDLYFDLQNIGSLDFIGDALRLSQILINFCSNAVKFTERGEVAVLVEQIEESNSMRTLHFCVKDTGVGMTPVQINKLFQAYSQTDASTSRVYGGTGLGLAISQSLIHLMNGRVWVESTPDRGTEFHFTIVVESGQQTEINEASSALSPVWRGCKALVLHPKENHGAAIVRLAQTIGLDCSYSQAIEGVRIESDDNYNVVLLDSSLLDGTSESISAFACALRQRPDCSIILLTTTEKSLDCIAKIKLLFDTHKVGVWIKPLLPDALVKELNKLSDASKIEDVVSPSRPLSNHEPVMPPANSDGNWLQNKRILVVDDNDLNREVLTRLLKPSGAVFITATNGREALDTLEGRDDIDCVLMDCQMPVMDGLTACREIRKQAKWKDLPVIALTASAFAEDRQNAFSAGMSDYLSKPLNMKRVKEVLQKWIPH